MEKAYYIEILDSGFVLDADHKKSAISNEQSLTDKVLIELKTAINKSVNKPSVSKLIISFSIDENPPTSD